MNTDEHGSAEKYDINGIEENWEIKNFQAIFCQKQSKRIFVGIVTYQ